MLIPYALNRKKEKDWISPHEANDTHDLSCVRCDGDVRLRKGHKNRWHFAHIHNSDCSGRGGESMDHKEAKRFITLNLHRLVFHRECESGSHIVEKSYPNCIAREETIMDKSCIADVGIFNGDNVVGIIEVFNTHRTSGEKMAIRETFVGKDDVFEVSVDEILNHMTNNPEGEIILMGCNRRWTTTCVPGCYMEKTYKRSSTQQECFSCDTMGELHFTIDGGYTTTKVREYVCVKCVHKCDNIGICTKLTAEDYSICYPCYIDKNLRLDEERKRKDTEERVHQLKRQRVEQQKWEEIRRVEQKKQEEIRRVEQKKQEEIQRVEQKKQEEIRIVEQKKQKEIRIVEQKKQEEIRIVEQKKQEELKRIKYEKDTANTAEIATFISENLHNMTLVKKCSISNHEYSEKYDNCTLKQHGMYMYIYRGSCHISTIKISNNIETQYHRDGPVTRWVVSVDDIHIMMNTNKTGVITLRDRRKRNVTTNNCRRICHFHDAEISPTIRKCDGCMTWGCKYFITYTNYSKYGQYAICHDCAIRCKCGNICIQKFRACKDCNLS